MIIAHKPRSDADRVTIDQLIRHNAQRTPHRMALSDSAHRGRWGGGEARRLTWSEVEIATNAMAQQLNVLGLPPDSTVALQLGASVDAVVVILGCLKAGLVPVMLPVTWRNAEASAAIDRVGAKAIIADCRIGGWQAAERLCEVAAENFAIRFVCSVGGMPPDGVVALDGAFSVSEAEAPPRAPRSGNAAEHVAIVTFDVGPMGPFPVARSHNEWLTAGLAALTELRLSRDSVLLSTLALTNLPGIGAVLIPWLMAGCRLALHSVFDRHEFSDQIVREDASHLALPATVAAAAIADGVIDDHPTIERLLAVARFGTSADLRMSGKAALSRLVVFGELGYVAGCEEIGMVPAGPVTAPLDVPDGVQVIETTVSQGVLAVRGGMTPQSGFPGDDRGGSRYPIGAGDWVATGYPASLDGDLIACAGTRRDVITLGGQSIAIAQTESLYADAPGFLSVGVRGEAHPILGEMLVLEAMPEDAANVSAVTLAMHAEEKQASPLKQSAEARIGDRRRVGALAGAA